MVYSRVEERLMSNLGHGDIGGMWDSFVALGSEDKGKEGGKPIHEDTEHRSLK